MTYLEDLEAYLEDTVEPQGRSVGHNRGVAEQGETGGTRIDRWLCAVRLVKTRPMATQLCEGGHVQVNGNAAKPSTRVRPGDEVRALIAARERIVDVVRPIETRVGAAVATECYVDRSPPPRMIGTTCSSPDRNARSLRDPWE